jgi:hypothetical protein
MAWMARRTSPAPGAPTSTSSIFRTSGAPNWWMRTWRVMGFVLRLVVFDEAKIAKAGRRR